VPGKTNRFIASGWEFKDQAALEAVIASLRGAGVEVRSGSADEAANRCVKQLVHCADPAGNRLELYFGRVYDYTPFSSARGLTGFVAGEKGMGHVVLPAPNLEQVRSFYKQHLGFEDTDEMWLQMSPNPSDPKLGIYFLHADNPRHHSLALVGAPAPSGCVHIMLQARTLDDVGYALDRCVAAGEHISSSFGKHSNDFMVSFYVATPGGFDLEFGCGGLEPDWKTWVPTVSTIGDLWGHKWSPPPAK
jgi:3,4-dihydroxy-9,10-secoandrosta-1,3,5(10)-triene-9,17-dione 4,5-dioxygenase